MELTKKEKSVMLKCVCHMNPDELKIYQRVNKKRLEEKLESIRKIHRMGMDLTGQDSIFVSAALGYIPNGYTS